MISRHGTLVANVTSTVTLPQDVDLIDVFNRGSGDIFFTTDGTEPAVAGSDTYVVPANSRVEVDAVGYNASVIKLISSGTPAYSVVADDVS